MSEYSLILGTMVSSTARAAPLAPDERRDALAAVFLDLVRAHGRVPTTAEIAAAAGVAEGTIFRAFATKEALQADAVQAVTEALAREIGFSASSSRRLGLENAALTMQEVTGERWEGVSGITPITESGLEGEVAAVARDFVELAPRVEVGLGPRQVVAHLRGDRQVLQGLEDMLTRGDLVPSDLTVRRQETEEPAA